MLIEKHGKNKFTIPSVISDVLEHGPLRYRDIAYVFYDSKGKGYFELSDSDDNPDVCIKTAHNFVSRNSSLFAKRRLVDTYRGVPVTFIFAKNRPEVRHDHATHEAYLNLFWLLLEWKTPLSVLEWKTFPKNQPGFTLPKKLEGKKRTHRPDRYALVSDNSGEKHLWFEFEMNQKSREATVETWRWYKKMFIAKKFPEPSFLIYLVPEKYLKWYLELAEEFSRTLPWEIHFTSLEAFIGNPIDPGYLTVERLPE